MSEPYPQHRCAHCSLLRCHAPDSVCAECVYLIASGEANSYCKRTALPTRADKLKDGFQREYGAVLTAPAIPFPTLPQGYTAPNWFHPLPGTHSPNGSYVPGRTTLWGPDSPNHNRSQCHMRLFGHNRISCKQHIRQCVPACPYAHEPRDKFAPLNGNSPEQCEWK